MTILEAIQANPVFADLSVNTIQYSLDSRSINGATTYDSSSLKNVELVTADLYVQISLMPEFKEGGLLIKLNASEYKRMALAIYKKYDDPKALELVPKPIDIGISGVDD